MSVARHPRSKELEGVPVEDIMKRYVGRFKEKKPDWAAFEDAKIEGFKRAQHRFIGAGGDLLHRAAQLFRRGRAFREPAGQFLRCRGDTFRRFGVARHRRPLGG